jgi:hypothetical protein
MITNVYAHLGRFYGDHFPADSLDAFVARTVKPKDWSVIADLYEKKWYGYRFISPGASLFLFADRYRKAYREVATRMLGRVHMPKWLNEDALHPESKHPMSASDISCMWIAMCMADELGIPYDFYCATALAYAHDRGWKYLPKPRQLYSDKMIWEIGEKWKERLASRITRTEDPHYSLANYDKHPWQHAYMDFLIKQAMDRDNPNFALASIMFKEPQVLPSYAATKVGVERVKEAHSRI